MDGGQDGDPEVDRPPPEPELEAAVLGGALLRDVELRHHLDAADDGLVVAPVDVVHRLGQGAVDAVLDHHLVLAGLDVDVGSAALDGVEHRRVDQLDDRALVGGDGVEGQDLLAVALVLHQLDAEVFGRLVEHPLGALGFLQDLLDRRGSSDLDLHRLAEEHLELVDPPDVGGIGHHHRHAVGELLLGDEAVAQHQVEGNAAEEVVLDAELPHVDEVQPVVGGQAAAPLVLLGEVGDAGLRAGQGAVGLRQAVQLCDVNVHGLGLGPSLINLGDGGEHRQVDRDQEQGDDAAHDDQHDRLDQRQQALNPGLDPFV